MKIYFANNQYLSIDYCHEEYRHGNRYLVFGIPDSKLSMEALLNFFSNKSFLEQIIIATDESKVLATFNNVYQSVYSIQRSLNIDQTALITVRLSSTETGFETLGTLTED